jgi:hypothetical protein
MRKKGYGCMAPFENYYKIMVIIITYMNIEEFNLKIHYLQFYVLHFKYKKVSHDVVLGMIDHFSNSSQKMKVLKMISWMSIGFAQRVETMQSIHGFGYKIVAWFLTNVEMIVVLMILFGYGCKF